MPAAETERAQQGEPNGLLILHRTLIRNSFYSLLFCSAVSLCVLAARVYLSQTHHYMFLVWNLFLAWIPFAFAVWVAMLDKIRPEARWLLLVPGTLWLLFFPNAPYLVTDLAHLQPQENVPFWYDLIMINTFVWTGFFLGLVSLFLMQMLVRRLAGRVASWLFAVGVVGLSSFGIYLGRFLRWNSWDALFRPTSLLNNLWDGLLHPLEHMQTLAFAVLFTLLFSAVYLMVLSFTHLHLEHQRR